MNRRERPDWWRWLALALLWLSLAAGAARAAVPVCPLPLDGLRIDTLASTWIDPTGQADARQARDQLARGAFRSHASTSPPNFGFVSGALWVHLMLPEVKERCTVLLVVGKTRIGRVDVFLPGMEGVNSPLAMGSELPFAERTVESRFPNLRIEREPGGPTPLLLRVVSQSSIQLPLTLHTAASLYRLRSLEMLPVGLFLGLMFGVLLYDFAVLLGTSDRNYAWMSAYVVAVIFYALTYHGYAFEYLWPDSPAIQQRAFPIAAAALLISALGFVAAFLGARRNVRWGWIGAKVMTAVFVGAALISAAGYVQLASRIVAGAALPTVALACAIGWSRMRSGSRSARLILASWVLFLLFAAATPLSAFGLMPRTFLGDYGAQVGAIVQMSVLAAALMLRIEGLRRERERLRMDRELSAQRRELENRIEDEEAERTALLDTMRVAILYGSAEGEVQWCNGEAETLLGTRLGEIRGKTLENMFDHPDEYQRSRADFRAAVERGEFYDAEVSLTRPDGGRIWALVRGRALVLEEPERGNVWCMLDITSRKTAENELRKALSGQRELTALKSRFITMASHELRTPLATVLASNELFKHFLDNMSPEERQMALNATDEAVQRITKLLDDVLRIGETENGIVFDPAPLLLREFAERQIQDALSAPQPRGVTPPGVELVIAPELDATPVLADANLLAQILAPLLSNAIKYAKPGGDVRVSLKRNEGALELAVLDNGIGIPPSDVDRIFEPFHRAANVSSIEGTGLGMLLVKRAVEMHGGVVTISSREGEGTIITVRLPMPVAAAPAAAVNPA